MKIVVLDGYTLNPGDLSWEGFEALGELTVFERTPEALIRERVSRADIVITNKTPLSRDVLSGARQIRYIGVLATGYNIVDVAAAKEFGIVATFIPSYGTDAVAQFTFALILELMNHVGEHSAAVKHGAWVKSEDFCFWNHPLIELSGKTLGIVGYGRIGGKTAEIARAFGMKVLVCDVDTGLTSGSDAVTYTDFSGLIAGADIISLHCPLFENTRGMINKQSISAMKDGVFIINTSRGPLIAEADLAEALDSGKVAGAAVDVLGSEPPSEDNPLLTAKNCIITPHIAWAPRESRIRLMSIAVENLSAFLAGKPVNTI